MGGVVTATVNTANKVGLILFEAAVGQRLSLGITDSTFSGSTVRVIKPDATTLASVSASTGTNLDMLIPLPGVYTVLIDPTGTSTGSMSLMLSEEINLGVFALDGPTVPVPVSRPGQTARLTFNNNVVNHYASIAVVANTFTDSTIVVYKPDGTQLSSISGVANGTILDILLPVLGTYIVRVNPTGNATGSLTLALNGAFDGSIAINGPPVTVTTTNIGERSQLSFTNSIANGKVSLHVGATSFSSSLFGSINVYRASDLVQVSSSCCINGLTLDMTLAQVGDYLILINPAGGETGYATLYLSEIVTGAIAIDGPAVTATIPRPGQQAQLTFTNSTANSNVSLHVGANSFSSSLYGSVNVYRASDLVQISGACCINGLTLNMNLAQVGDYFIVINPAGGETGYATVYLSEEVNAGSIAINGTSASITTTLPGQTGYLTFSPSSTLPQNATLTITASSFSTSLYGGLAVYNPAGSNIGGICCVAYGSMGMQLATPGTYKISLNPAGSETGTITFTLTSP